MLIKNFYTVHSLDTIGTSNYQAQIELNPEHEIFKGHFPNNPVMPGVCMIQILKELTETVTQQTLFMNKASNVKFMTLINPEVNCNLKFLFDISGEKDNLKVKSTISFEETIALKMTNFFNICD